MTGGGGSVGRRADERRGKDAGKVTLTATRTFIPKFTFSVNRQAIRRVNIGNGSWMEGKI